MAYDVLNFSLAYQKGGKLEFDSLCAELVDEGFAIGQLLSRKDKGRSYEFFDYTGRTIGGLEFHEKPVAYTRKDSGTLAILAVAFERPYKDRVIRALGKVGLDMTQARPI